MRIFGITVLSFILCCSQKFPSSASMDESFAWMLGSSLLQKCLGQGYCRIFAASSVMPDMGASPSGIAGADARCNSDANKPGSGTYRALVSGTERTASLTSNTGDGQTGWVLYPETEYRRSDGLIVFTTNTASIFVFGTAQNFITGAGNIHTGLLGDWTTGANCNSWTDASGVASGRYGVGGVTGATLLSLTQSACNTARGIYCVQQ